MYGGGEYHRQVHNKVTFDGNSTCLKLTSVEVGVSPDTTRQHPSEKLGHKRLAFETHIIIYK